MADNGQRILAIGGVSIGPSSTDWPLHQYVLDLSGRERPRICYVGTAGGDSADDRAGFYATFARHAEATHLDLFGRRVDDIEGFLVEQDAVYVGGGNTANMLAIWRVHGVDKAIRTAWERGVVLAGWSAGAICWFEGGTTDSFGPRLRAFTGGLGLLAGSFCPHYSSEPARRPLYEELVAGGTLPPGVACDDGAAAHYVDGALATIVTEQADRHGYRVEPDGAGGVTSITLAEELLP